jgi:voltage-gated potassium channel
VWAQVRRAALFIAIPLVAGTIGYLLFGLSPVDAVYQTVITVATVGTTEVDEPWGPGRRLFTVALIVGGVVSVTYAVGLLLDVLVENRIALHLSERRMTKAIEGMKGHIVVCGMGRVGRTIADQLAREHREVVVIDRDPERFARCEHPHVLGDATKDDVLEAAGVGRAVTLVTALDTDAANLFVALSGRAMNPSLFIVARARDENAVVKLHQAGADRVVNPQSIGAARMAALTLQPNVAEFLEVAMREGPFAFRLSELVVAEGSHLAGRTLRDAHIRDQTGALVLAFRHGGVFNANPDPDTMMQAGDLLIAIGTDDQLGKLAKLAE